MPSTKARESGSIRARWCGILHRDRDRPAASGGARARLRVANRDLMSQTPERHVSGGKAV
jgi:hypothetical protein